MDERRKQSIYLRNIVFGAIDSLVSTVGLLAGIAVGSIPTHVVVLTGVVYVFVEGFSMAMGSFLSEDAAEEFAAQADIADKQTISGGLVMFASFILIGFIPIAPYVFLTGLSALIGSIILSLIALAGIAYLQARLSSLPSIRRIVRMVVLGSVAIIIGITVSKIFGVS